MGKSAHKSRKRKRSPSRDRLTRLEDKLSRLINVLSRNEVRPPSVPSPSASVSSLLARQDDQESNGDGDQEGTMCPHDSGVYEHPGSVNQMEESTQPFLTNQNNLSSSAALTPPLPKTIILEEDGAPADVPDEASADTLSKELFGSEPEGSNALPWNDLVIRTWRDLSQKGLSPQLREALLKKYSPSEEAIFLKAPRLNPECKSALKNNAIVKRDEYGCANQDQVGTALFAIGEAISEFLKPDTQLSLNSEARMAVAKVNEGAKILADLFYRLSLSRRALIKPSFNILAKKTADAIPADNLLFGSSFGEEIKKATTMEKSSRDIVNTPLTISKKVQQPIRLPAQTATSKSVNSRAPVSRTRSTATRRTGASSSSRRSSDHYASRSKRR